MSNSTVHINAIAHNIIRPNVIPVLAPFALYVFISPPLGSYISAALFYVYRHIYLYTDSRWNAFVADMANTTSGIIDHGKGKFFALACDLDFNGITFAPVNNFAGKFYGLGHTISNITYDANGKHCPTKGLADIS